MIYNVWWWCRMTGSTVHYVEVIEGVRYYLDLPPLGTGAHPESLVSKQPLQGLGCGLLTRLGHDALKTILTPLDLPESQYMQTYNNAGLLKAPLQHCQLAFFGKAFSFLIIEL